MCASLPQTIILIPPTALTSCQSFLKMVRSRTEVTELTTEIVHEFIKRVEVSEAEYTPARFSHWAKGKTQSVRIVYNYIDDISETFKDDFLRIIKFETTAAQAESLGINAIAKKVGSKMTELLGWQSQRIAQTEVLSAASVAQNESVKSVGVPYQKTWVAAMINTRHSHKAMHGTIAKNVGMFVLPDGSKMEYPRDARFGAPAGEIINCQCFVIYEPKRDW